MPKERKRRVHIPHMAHITSIDTFVTHGEIDRQCIEEKLDNAQKVTLQWLARTISVYLRAKPEHIHYAATKLTLDQLHKAADAINLAINAMSVIPRR